MKAKIAHKTLKLKQNFTLLLLVALVCSLMAFSITAIADAELPTAGDQPVALAEETPEETPGDATKGMEINKTAKLNDDGTYQITLEAYATGQKVTTSVQKDVPTDIILVLDQSGSMKNNMTVEGYAEYTKDQMTYNTQNSTMYSYRHNGGNSNLYYQYDDGKYAAVSVIREQGYTYTPYEKSSGHNFFYRNQNNLYAKVGDEYQKVTLNGFRDEYYVDTNRYEYRLPDETVIATASRGMLSTSWTLSDISDTVGGKLYVLSEDDTKNVYTYSYTVKNDAGQDVTTVIGSSTGANTDYTDKTFYYYNETSIIKLDALQTAVKAFADSVTEKAKGADGEYGGGDDVNHRIAVVGFASGVRGNDEYPAYGNTELFIGSTQYNYNTNASSQYASAFQDMSTEAGYKNVIDSKDALDAKGATCVDLGLDMANGIFAANPVPENETRNRVVIVFTDGEPNDWDGFDDNVADNAVSKAYTAKNTYGANVYTIGVLDGASGEPVTSFDGVSDINKFLHLVSSNYKNAESYSDSDKYGASTYPTNGSYYLTAANATDLNSIFQQIADQVQTGGSTTELTSSAVIKDIIAPQFQLPAGATAANITLETYAYTAANTWTKNDTAMGATATVNATTGNVDVTGFDFAENWCGTETSDGNATYRGNKLVIKFNVQTKPGFLGGNDVYTNTSAGVYENADATEPVLTFPKPTVNVPIGAVAVTAADKNVYLLGSLTAEQIKSGATATCGGVSLNLAADNNYGLEPWQTDYVNITVTYKDASGNTITNVSDLKDDTTYTVAVTVTPKTVTPVSTQGETATTQTNSAAGNIKVFKPELTFKDSTVYYGDNAPTDYSGNKTGEVWKHGETTSTDTGVTMTGTAPTLALTYTPANGVKDGKIAVKTDIPVDVTVKIGEGDAATDVTNKTTFNHTKCNTNEANPTDGKFWLHVNTCSLTITKAAGIDTKTEEKVSFGTNESFVFNVYKDNNLYTQLTITGTGSVIIKELPVGNYTVAEDTSWSWRYNPTITGSGNLTAASPTGTITCTNNLTTKQWLNGFSAIVKNVFGAKQAQ